MHRFSQHGMNKPPLLREELQITSSARRPAFKKTEIHMRRCPYLETKVHCDGVSGFQSKTDFTPLK